MPGWEGSRRKEELPPGWDKIRKRILARDHDRCTWLVDGVRCDRKANQVDHIIRGQDHSDSNLRSLCWPHHQEKSSREGGTAPRRRTRYHASRPPEQHPGIRKPR